MANQKSDMILYSYFRSSCSARIRIALNLKNVPYDLEFVNLLKDEQSSVHYHAINPSNFVPTLRISTLDKNLVQSVAILEYLDEKYPHTHQLLPPLSDPLGRAAVRALVGVIACDTQPVTNLRILSRIDKLDGNKMEWARELMTDGLTAYERLAAGMAGKYSYGDTVTMADACLVPAVWGALRFGVDMKALPTVERVYEELSRLEEVRKAHWKNQDDTPLELRE